MSGSGDGDARCKMEVSTYIELVLVVVHQVVQLPAPLVQTRSLTLTVYCKTAED